MPPPDKKKSAATDSFDGVALSVASPEDILGWSRGEVTKPETVNYRTQRAEPDGLFCERIFGPTKNFQCFCGKYKGIRYAGVICEKCGVEVTRSIVRRERMGHINLAVPVTHIWFLRSSPSRLGLLLDLPIKTLEQIVYFAAYIVISADTEQKTIALEELKRDRDQRSKNIKREFEQAKIALQSSKASKAQLAALEKETADNMDDLKESYDTAVKDLNQLEVGGVLGELKFRELNMKFGHLFRAGTGAESLREIIMNMDLPQLLEQLQEDRKNSSGQKLKKIMKRIKFVSSLMKANIKPEWMILTRLQIIPPDLRPMVQLDGGRFAASDLNDLYRRVINRNNRLKKLMGIGAPEVINRNEKRMLQESVDTLLNNSGRGGRALFTAGDRRKLRSLSDMLKGKQGRFRQNLLGKRVDYSGRSVIVVGPTLKLNQCGLPKKMAMKLFKPFVIGQLIQMEYAHNVKGAEKLITEGQKYVWDILEEVIHEKYVLLNRAPTLHRLGIQAFNPVLIDGKAIQLHPLVCAAYNADFDGDQMAVHLPLSDRAQREAKELMSSATNVLKPSAGEPVIDPTQDMVLGCYFITQVHDGKKGEGMNFGSSKEAILAFETGLVDVQAKVNVRMRDVQEEGMVETSIGRLMFNNIMPEGMEYINVVQRKKDLSKLVALSLDTVGTKETVLFADRIKDLGFKAATMSGISMAASDLVSSDQREGMIDASREIIKDIQDYYDQGIITEDERYTHAIKLWSKTKNEITAVTVDEFKKNPENDVYYIIDSAARGNWGQVTQLAGMKGLVANPSGKTIELPIQSNLKLGFSVLEYFIATHGGRKGKSDTALKTAEAGYLTRRLVDAVQDIIIREEDCGSKEVHWITQADSERIGEKLESRIFGRSLAEAIKVDGKTIAKRNEEIDANVIEKLMANDITEIPVRSMMTCKTRKGICIKCYGRDLGDNKTVEIGVPVGLIAAQSIGEPGTQLTMRTFHMGGVADGADITQGLTRVEELFEARNPKTPAVLSDISGKIKIGHKGDKRIVRVMSEELGTDIYAVPAGYEVVVKKGDLMKERGVIAKSTNDKSVLRATIAGTVEKAGHREIHIKHEENQVRSYEFTSRDSLIVKNNQEVEAGEALSMGHYNLQELLQKRGAYVAQNYVVQEVQHIYASQGQTINDKHLEIIVRKMFSKVRILNAGDTKLLPGEVVDIGEVEYQLEQVKLKNKDAEGATYEQILLGISRAALATDSWLAGASFQETVRVLVEAATTNSVDKLQGLKENVIIGRLIPTGEVYRKRFGGEEEKENAADAKTVDAKEETESEE